MADENKRKTKEKLLEQLAAAQKEAKTAREELAEERKIGADSRAVVICRSLDLYVSTGDEKYYGEAKRLADGLDASKWAFLGEAATKEMQPGPAVSSRVRHVWKVIKDRDSFSHQEIAKTRYDDAQRFQHDAYDSEQSFRIVRTHHPVYLKDRSILFHEYVPAPTQEDVLELLLREVKRGGKPHGKHKENDELIARGRLARRIIDTILDVTIDGLVYWIKESGTPKQSGEEIKKWYLEHLIKVPGTFVSEGIIGPSRFSRAEGEAWNVASGGLLGHLDYAAIVRCLDLTPRNVLHHLRKLKLAKDKPAQAELLAEFTTGWKKPNGKYTFATAEVDEKAIRDSVLHIDTGYRGMIPIEDAVHVAVGPVVWRYSGTATSTTDRIRTRFERGLNTIGMATNGKNFTDTAFFVTAAYRAAQSMGMGVTFGRNAFEIYLESLPQNPSAQRVYNQRLERFGRKVHENNRVAQFMLLHLAEEALKTLRGEPSCREVYDWAQPFIDGRRLDEEGARRYHALLGRGGHDETAQLVLHATLQHAYLAKLAAYFQRLSFTPKER